MLAQNAPPAEGATGTGASLNLKAIAELRSLDQPSFLHEQMRQLIQPCMARTPSSEMVATFVVDADAPNDVYVGTDDEGCECAILIYVSCEARSPTARWSGRATTGRRLRS